MQNGFSQIDLKGKFWSNFSEIYYKMLDHLTVWLYHWINAITCLAIIIFQFAIALIKLDFLKHLKILESLAPFYLTQSIILMSPKKCHDSNSGWYWKLV